MSFVKKALKVVAVVAAVALAIPTGGTSLLALTLGVSAVAATAIAAGLMVASSLLNKPKVPAISQAALSRLNVSIDPRTPRKIVFGETAMGADLRDMEYAGTDNMYVHYFIVLAGHEVNSVKQLYLDDKLAWDSAGVKSPFTNYLTVATRTVGTAANAIDIGPRMGSARRYTGLAYIHLRFRRTGLDSKAQSPFSSSLPSRITTVGEGMKCYDPRRDSTVQGGSGTMRANDQSTWTYGSHARNPACQLLTYLLGWRINGMLSVGKGYPAARLDMQSFMAAANACDVPIELAAGGTQARYRSDGMLSEADGLEAVIETFKVTMNAELDDSGGKMALRMLLNDLDDPVAHFGPDQFLGGLTWRPVTDISDRVNRIAGQFVDPRPLSLYQMVDYPEVSIPSIDGIERSLPRGFAMVQDAAQAQRTAKEVLQRAQYGGLLEVTVDHTGWRVQKYDIVTVTHPPLGFVNKLFRVADISVGLHGQVPLVLREENAAIYAWDREDKAPVQPVAPTTYDYSTDPIIMAIEDAGGVDVIWTKNSTPPAKPADSAGTPAGWFATSGELPLLDIPVWVSYGLRGDGGLYEWQDPVQTVFDERYWEAVDETGVIREDKVVEDSVLDGAISTAKIRDLSVETLKIAGNAVTLPLTANTISLIVPSGNTTEWTVVETAELIIGTSTEPASIAIYFFAGVETNGGLGTEADSAGEAILYVDKLDGAGYQRISGIRAGCRSTSGNTFYYIPVSLVGMVHGIVSCKIKIIYHSVYAPQQTTYRSTQITSGRMVVEGIKR